MPKSVFVAALILSAAPAYAYDGENLASKAALSVDEAQAIALKAQPGEIKEKELEEESGGTGLRYSFDIASAGQMYEVGVDANSGVVLEDGVARKGDADHEESSDSEHDDEAHESKGK